MSEPRQTERRGALDFIHHEATGGLILLAAAVVAMVLANSSAASLYDAFLATPVSVRIGALAIDKALLLWINDGLMAVFFLLVGLEIKRELLVGELSTPQQAMLPALAALGGMIAPALVYLAVTIRSPEAQAGWAIPAATDIAFAVGVLALLGPRVPPALKVFLLALAIIDDLGAIVIIGVFYSGKLSTVALALAALSTLGLVVLNRMGVTRIAPYIVMGVVVWVCVLKSGVHATLAGVVTALTIPLVRQGGSLDEAEHGPAAHLEHTLHDWVKFLVLPLFAFANAGVELAGVTLAKLADPIPAGIALGLVVGKQIGIYGATWLALRSGLASPPAGVTLLQIYGVSLLGGIGFTMSLFIGALAFPEAERAVDIRIGVLVGSFVSAVCGYLVLRIAIRAQPPV